MKNYVETEAKIMYSGIKYVKSETIFIIAEGYNKKKRYRKFLGRVVKKFCIFSISETFGNGFKPYYEYDAEKEIIWSELVCKYRDIFPSEFQSMNHIFEEISETKWIDELVLQYPQFIVKSSTKMRTTCASLKRHFQKFQLFIKIL